MPISIWSNKNSHQKRNMMMLHILRQIFYSLLFLISLTWSPLIFALKIVYLFTLFDWFRLIWSRCNSFIKIEFRSFTLLYVHYVCLYECFYSFNCNEWNVDNAHQKKLIFCHIRSYRKNRETHVRVCCTVHTYIKEYMTNNTQCYVDL